MNNEKEETIYNVPLWEKVMLTIDEAAAYTGVGSRKIRQLTDNERCPFVLVLPRLFLLYFIPAI